MNGLMSDSCETLVARGGRDTDIGTTHHKYIEPPPLAFAIDALKNATETVAFNCQIFLLGWRPGRVDCLLIELCRGEGRKVLYSYIDAIIKTKECQRSW